MKTKHVTGADHPYKESKNQKIKTNRKEGPSLFKRMSEENLNKDHLRFKLLMADIFGGLVCLGLFLHWILT